MLAIHVGMILINNDKKVLKMSDSMKGFVSSNKSVENASTICTYKKRNTGNSLRHARTCLV